MDTIDDLKDERAAVAMLLAAAQQAIETAPEAVGGIDDLHALFEKQKELAAQQKVLKNHETDLLAKLQQVREQHSALEHQAEAVKTKAAQLFEAIFGKPERPISPAPPRPTLQIAKPAEGPALPENVPQEAHLVRQIPSSNF